MTKTPLKIISIIFGVIAIYFTINLIPDKTKKKFTALDKYYSFTKEISISEKFKTDFDSAYKVLVYFENANDSLAPIKKNMKVYRNGEAVELYGNENNHFVSKSGATYELKLELEGAKGNLTKNEIQIKIVEDNLSGPTYELLIEREYKWLLWTIDGLIILIALITGYFGFKKKANR